MFIVLLRKSSGRQLFQIWFYFIGKVVKAISRQLYTYCQFLGINLGEAGFGEPTENLRRLIDSKKHCLCEQIALNILTGHLFYYTRKERHTELEKFKVLL